MNFNLGGLPMKSKITFLLLLIKWIFITLSISFQCVNASSEEKTLKKTIEETEESTSAIETGESSNNGSVPLPISDLDPGPQK